MDNEFNLFEHLTEKNRETIDKNKEYDKVVKSNLKLIDEIRLLKDDKIYLKNSLRDISDRVDKIIKEAKLEGTNEIKLSQIIALKRNIEKYKYVKN